MDRQTDEKLIARFLLGNLAEQDRVALEERFFADDDFYSQMLAIQEELADDYVCGDLSESEREQFERRFLTSPYRRRRVEFAATLAKALPEMRDEQAKSATSAWDVSWWRAPLGFLRTQSPAFTLAIYAAIFLLLFGITWLEIENRRLDAQLERARDEQGRFSKQAQADREEFEREEKKRRQQMIELQSQRDEKDAKLRDERRRVEEIERRAASEHRRNELRPSDNLVSFALLPGLVRGSGNEPADEPEKIVIPPKTNSIRLQLELDKEENYRSYRTELRTAGGNLVWSQTLLAPKQSGGSQVVPVTLPASILSQGEYEVTLAGVNRDGAREVISYYYFIALKR